MKLPATGNASKVREYRLSLAAVFAGSAMVALLLCIGLALGSVELGLNLTIVGLVLALLLPLGLEIRHRAGRRRRVLVLDYRRHHYGHAVSRG